MREDILAAIEHAAAHGEPLARPQQEQPGGETWTWWAEDLGEDGQRAAFDGWDAEDEHR